MTNETKQKALSMIQDGYNLNQIASILMVDKLVLMSELNGSTGISTGKLIIKTTSEGNTEGTSGGSGYSDPTTSGWQNEEGL
jgi:hypothetical protein